VKACFFHKPSRKLHRTIGKNFSFENSGGNGLKWSVPINEHTLSGTGSNTDRLAKFKQKNLLHVFAKFSDQQAQ
jgi:hypothetical protein